MSESNDQFVECGLEEGTNFFDRPYLAENVEDILKGIFFCLYNLI